MPVDAEVVLNEKLVDGWFVTLSEKLFDICEVPPNEKPVDAWVVLANEKLVATVGVALKEIVVEV